MHSSQPVRRVLSYFRSGDHLSRTTVADGLKQPTRRHRTGNSLRLLLGLAPDGVYLADTVTRIAGELLPHRFTLTALCSGLFSVALARESPRVAVSHHPALWSPDVPRDKSRAAAQPTDMHREF